LHNPRRGDRLRRRGYLELEENFQVFDWDLIVDIVLVRARLENDVVVQGQVLHKGIIMDYEDQRRLSQNVRAVHHHEEVE